MEKIEMTFETDLRNLVAITVPNAKVATDNEVKDAMNKIISCGAVNMKKGVPMYRASARRLHTATKEYDLTFPS